MIMGKMLLPSSQTTLINILQNQNKYEEMEVNKSYIEESIVRILALHRLMQMKSDALFSWFSLYIPVNQVTIRVMKK